MKMRFDPKLYLVTDSTGLEEEIFLKTVERACRNGVTMVQLREKERSSREVLRLARLVREVTDRFSIPLIIDDRADVALAAGAAGVHVGQSDLPVECVRRLLGEERIVGATAKTVDQAREAYRQGADYLGVGAIYPTTTKVVTVRTELSTLQEICAAVPIPVNAIGGLNAENCGILEGIAIAGVCIVSAVMKAPDPGSAAASLFQNVERMLGGVEK